MMEYNASGKKENDFGSTYDLHSALMAIIWGPGINVAIIVVLYSYRKYYIYLHAFCGIFATIYSIATSLPILLTTGILSTDQAGGQHHVTGQTIYAHYIVGITSLSVILLQAILGITTRVLNIYNVSTSSLIFIKYAHTILGYMVSILSKSNVYIIYGPSNGDFWLFFVQDFLFALIIIARKIYFPKIKKVIIPKDIRQDLNKKSVHQSLNDLDEEKGYCVFSNIIYSLQPMKINHPGGYRIIESVKNRDVDRFIYGMYGSQAMPQISPHSHSFRSLELLGKPVGYINIKSCYSGFNDQIGCVDVSIKQINSVSTKGKIYEVQLKKQVGKFNFNNYQDILQLGRFYSLTFRNTTRLYTAVNFLSIKNKQLMHRFFKQIPHDQINYSSQSYSPPSQQGSNKFQQESDYVPLLIKVYPGGQLTEKLIQNPNNSLKLSHEKGLGLHLQSFLSNNIIIIAGGTGLFPFYDLIDLFFKNQVIKHNEGERQAFIKHEPILNKYSFNHLVIDVFLSVASIQDIHPIIYRQFVYLLKNTKHFSLTLRTTTQLSPDLNSELMSVGCKIISQRFEQILEEKLFQKQKSKIYICGPPRMNQSLSKYFRDRSYNPSLYCFM